MENINNLIENNTSNFTRRSSGDEHFYYCRHVYFHCYCIFVNTLDTSQTLLISTTVIASVSDRMQRLQLIQNSAARVLSQTKRYTSITPIQDELNWLPINKRCQFKILLLTFKSLNGCVPECIYDMIKVYYLYNLLHLHHLCHIEI